MISSIGKYLALALLLLGITTFMTTDATPTPATADEIREFKLWVQYAKAAYDDVTGWKCADCGGDTAGTRLIQKFPVAPTWDNGYVAMNDKEKAIIVAYRGLTDLDTLTKLLSQCQARNYPPITFSYVVDLFMEFYQTTSGEILSLVEDLVAKNPSYKVIVTGHSIGGSLATYTAVDLIYNSTSGLNPSNLFTYTFGAPCVANNAYTNYIEDSDVQFFRLVDRNDPIPNSPSALFNQYAPEYFIDTNMKMVVCQNLVDPGCSLSLPNKDLKTHLAYFDDLASM